jgi:hypothetical protein
VRSTYRWITHGCDTSSCTAQERDAGQWLLYGSNLPATPGRRTARGVAGITALHEPGAFDPHLSSNRSVVGIEADPAVLYQAPLLSILSDEGVDRRPLLDDQSR